MVTRRTHKGTEIDIDALVKNTPLNKPAVGNMRVNARGDVLGPQGEIVQKSEDRARAYYKDNPKSSTANASLKGKEKTLRPDVVTPSQVVDNGLEEFDAPQEPLGYKEVELENGNIQMVPYYKEEDSGL